MDAIDKKLSQSLDSLIKDNQQKQKPKTVSTTQGSKPGRPSFSKAEALNRPGRGGKPAGKPAGNALAPKTVSLKVKREPGIQSKSRAVPVVSGRPIGGGSRGGSNGGRGSGGRGSIPSGRGRSQPNRNFKPAGPSQGRAQEADRGRSLEADKIALEEKITIHLQNNLCDPGGVQQRIPYIAEQRGSVLNSYGATMPNGIW